MSANNKKLPSHILCSVPQPWLAVLILELTPASCRRDIQEPAITFQKFTVQSIQHVKWHSTRHFSVNAKNCSQTQTLTVQSANKAKLLYSMITDCPVVTQITQMLQPTVMITYLPLNSNKVCSPPSLERATVDNDRHKDTFTDIRRATGLKHPDMYTD